MGEYSKAAEHYELVLGGKCPELNPRRAKGKVSLQVRLTANSAQLTDAEHGCAPFERWTGGAARGEACMMSIDRSLWDQFRHLGWSFPSSAKCYAPSASVPCSAPRPPCASPARTTPRSLTTTSAREMCVQDPVSMRC